MTTYYYDQQKLAEKWSNPGLSENRSRSVSRNPPTQPRDPAEETSNGLKRRYISLKLSGMPKDVTVQQLWKNFSPRGSIQLIDLFDARPQDTWATGKIIFEPPPKISFWKNNSLDITLDGHEKPVTIHVAVMEGRPEAQQSMEEQRCPPIISMPLKSLDFGSLANKDTMVIGETINSEEKNDLSLELDTHKGEITMHFQFPEKLKHVSRRRQYKMVTPVSSIKKV